ncbi:acetyltransferase [Loa loa]|uniref:N-terminal methionine N(alpha)-acetyltransferase NatE n=1 Tax=Loa loa TaxID=7209 RepID=A0A1I7V705_LOALO|nr:acetyltransferase [Loa loa]EFO17087.1 acetyltransferase [Loa loa]
MAPSENAENANDNSKNQRGACEVNGLSFVMKDEPRRVRCVGRCDMELGDITHHNVEQLKRLNQAVFPVAYNDKFYKEIVTAGELAKLAYFNDIVVGGVCCRIDTQSGIRRLYIMTLGTLAPYRRLGIGTMLLEHVFTLCDKDPTIENIFLHVQINNESALDFYKRFGFEVVGVAEKYYKRIEPDSAYILVKRIEREVREHLP